MAKFRKRLFYKRNQTNVYSAKNGFTRTNAFVPRKFNLGGIISFVQTLPGIIIALFVIFQYSQIKDFVLSLFQNFWFSANINNQPKNDATILFNAMNRFGTDFPTILKTLKGKSEKEYLKIVSSFGLRNYNKVWGYDTNSIITGGEKQNLHIWLKEELNEFEIFTLLKELPYLKKYGF
jgi:hypothetical protein